MFFYLRILGNFAYMSFYTQLGKNKRAAVGMHHTLPRNIVFVAVFHGCTSTGRVGLCFLWFFVQELPKAQPAVVLVLKRLRRRGNGLKSHPTDWEKPGIEPATPGLQDIGLSPTPRRLLLIHKSKAITQLKMYENLNAVVLT